MKRFSLNPTVFFLLICLLIFGCNKTDTDDEALQETISNNSLLLNESGNEAQIVISDNFDKELIGISSGYQTVYFAAELIQKYFENVTGTQLEIVIDSNADPSRPHIALGRSKANDYLEDERSSLALGGFLVRRNNNQISIVGKVTPSTLADYTRYPDFIDIPLIDRGLIFGVAEFIEKVLGVKWYFPDALGIIIPKKELITVTDLLLTDAPYFKQREAWYGTNTFLEESARLAFRDLLILGFRLGNSSEFSLSHTDVFYSNSDLDHIYSFQDKVGKDILAKNEEGKLVYHTNKEGTKFYHLNYLPDDTLQFQMERLAAFLSKQDDFYHVSKPTLKYAKFFPSDLENIYHDQSIESQQLWITDDPLYKNSKLSNIIFSFAAKFAGRVNIVYPSMRLAFASYAGYMLPPKEIAMPKNADVIICTLNGNSALVSPEHKNYTESLIDTWWKYLGRDKGRIFLWEYDGAYPNMPLILFPKTMREWYQFNKEKTSGFFLESHLQNSENMRRNILNNWIRAKLWWNPNADTDKLISEFCSDLFGPAAEAMKEVFTITAKQYEERAKTVFTNLIPGAATESAGPERYCIAVYTQEFFDSINHTFETAKQKVNPTSVESKRIEFFQEGYKDLQEKCVIYY